MPGSHSVTATFNPPDETSWSFNPQKVEVNGGGKIKMQRSTTVTPEWVFASQQPGLPSWCTFNVQAGGATLEIDDQGPSTNGQYVSYTVAVTWNGATYTSPLTSASPPTATATSTSFSSTSTSDSTTTTDTNLTATGGTGVPPMIMNQ